MQKLSSLILIFCLCLPILSEQVYRKIIHNTDPEAKCLDGSPGALYVHQGTQQGKFFIYFIGGGFCGVNTLSGTLEDCYQRSRTRFGSSHLWPDTIGEKDGTEGILSLNQNLYKNWTKILFAYCDGALHQGSNMNPIEYKDTKLYFRGNLIVRSHFKWLIENYQIDKASKILLSGGSAGAVASIQWGNYLQSIVKDPKIVFNVPDCGVFLNVRAFETYFPEIELRIRNVMKLAFGEEQTPLQQCNKQYEGQEQKCTFLEYNYPYLMGKILFVESEYDAWAIANILKIGCLRGTETGSTLKYCSQSELRAIQTYRNHYLFLMNQKVKSQERGTWSIACAKHCYLSGNEGYNSSSVRIPSLNGLNPQDAVEEFVIKQKINWSIDQNPWPSNEPCAY